MKKQKSNQNKYVRAKKFLGQHFLKDENIAGQICTLLDFQSGNTIVEIGPGMGVLSAILKNTIADYELEYKMVELDSESVEYLNKTGLYSSENIQIIQGDILKMKWEDLGSKIELISNLPYNISSPVFFKIIENHSPINKGVFMVQKEVAERICASHGSKTYGILSVLMQSLFECTLHFDVSPESFIPPPKVMSSVFTIKAKDKAIEKDLIPVLKAIVKKSFNNRRKMLRNTLSEELNGLGEEFEKYLTLRPEQISVADFIYLAQKISDK